MRLKKINNNKKRKRLFIVFPRALQIDAFTSFPQQTNTRYALQMGRVRKIQVPFLLKAITKRVLVVIEPATTRTRVLGVHDCATLNLYVLAGSREAQNDWSSICKS